MDILSGYLDIAIPGISESWKPRGLGSLATVNCPSSLFIGRESLLKADIHFLWLSWFIESIYDFNLAPENAKYPDVISSVRRGLVKSGFNLDDASFNDVSKTIARLIYTYLSKTRGRSRKPITKYFKQELIEAANGTPYCWICGAQFKRESIDAFLGKQVKFKLSPIVDYMFPRGLKERDFKIEVEHKLPFSIGGDDIENIENIDLSCGYCNRHKWKFLSIYDANKSLRTYAHSRLGMVSVPQPYWAIRLLALSEKCAEAGCTAKKVNQPLFIDMINNLGSAAPSNLKVVCRKHLTNSGDRFVSSTQFLEKLKKGRAHIV